MRETNHAMKSSAKLVVVTLAGCLFAGGSAAAGSAALHRDLDATRQFVAHARNHPAIAAAAAAPVVTQAKLAALSRFKSAWNAEARQSYSVTARSFIARSR